MLKRRKNNKKPISVKEVVSAIEKTENLFNVDISGTFKKLLLHDLTDTPKRAEKNLYRINIYREEYKKLPEENEKEKTQTLYHLARNLILSAFILKELGGKILDKNNIVNFIDRNKVEEWINKNKTIAEGCNSYHNCKNKQSDAVMAFEYMLYQNISDALRQLELLKGKINNIDILLKEATSILNRLYDNINQSFNQYKEDPVTFIKKYRNDCPILQKHFNYIRSRARELNIYLPYAVLVTPSWFSNSFRITYETADRIKQLRKVIDNKNLDIYTRQMALISYAVTVAESEEKIYININKDKIQAKIAYFAIRSVYNIAQGYKRDNMEDSNAVLNLIKSNDGIYTISLAYYFLKKEVNKFYNNLVASNNVEDLHWNKSDLKAISKLYTLWMLGRLEWLTGREVKITDAQRSIIEETKRNLLIKDSKQHLLRRQEEIVSLI